MVRIDLERHDFALLANSARHPYGAVRAEGSDLKDATRASRTDQQFQELALQRCYVDSRKIGFAIGCGCCIEGCVGWDQPFREEAVDLLPGIKRFRGQGEAPREVNFAVAN